MLLATAATAGAGRIRWARESLVRGLFGELPVALGHSGRLGEAFRSVRRKQKGPWHLLIPGVVVQALEPLTLEECCDFARSLGGMGPRSQRKTPRTRIRL